MASSDTDLSDEAPDYGVVAAALASLASQPVQLLRLQYSRDDLLVRRLQARRVLDWLAGQQQLLEKGPPDHRERRLEATGWVVGVAGFVTSVVDGLVSGLSGWALAGLFLAVPSFLLGAWQTQRRIDKEYEAFDAAVALREQIRLIHAAIDKIDLALRKT